MRSSKWNLLKWHYDRNKQITNRELNHWIFIDKVIAVIVLARPLYDIICLVWAVLQTPLGMRLMFMMSLLFWIGQLIVERWSLHWSSGMMRVNAFIHTTVISGWHIYWASRYFPNMPLDNIGDYFDHFLARWLFLAMLYTSLFMWGFAMKSFAGHRNLVFLYSNLFLVYRVAIQPFIFSSMLQQIGLHVVISCVTTMITIRVYGKIEDWMKRGEDICLTK